LAADWIIPTLSGYYVRPGDFYLDPKAAVPIAVISHAHGDHFHTGCGTAYATPGTLRLIQTQTQKPLASKIESMPYDKTIRIGETQVTLWPAGHIPGSAMISIQYKGMHALYTGDISTEIHAMAEPLTLPDTPVDWLICESTFADMPFLASDPQLAFEAVCKRAAASRMPILLGVYALGKAQRISSLIHQHLEEANVMADPRIQAFHQAYLELGFSPGSVQPYRRIKHQQKGLNFILMPPSAFMRMAQSGKFHAAFVSGWDKRSVQSGINDVLPISDHPDATELRKFIKAVAPKILSPVHGKYASLRSFCADNRIELNTQLST
jgi:putative mRNA 3-end processing factor